MILPICSDRNTKVHTSLQPSPVDMHTVYSPHKCKSYRVGIKEGDRSSQHAGKQLLMQHGRGTNASIGKKEGSKESEYLIQ